MRTFEIIDASHTKASVMSLFLKSYTLADINYRYQFGKRLIHSLRLSRSQAGRLHDRLCASIAEATQQLAVFGETAAEHRGRSIEDEFADRLVSCVDWVSSTTLLPEDRIQGLSPLLPAALANRFGDDKACEIVKFTPSITTTDYTVRAAYAAAKYRYAVHSWTRVVVDLLRREFRGIDIDCQGSITGRDSELVTMLSLANALWDPLLIKESTEIALRTYVMSDDWDSYSVMGLFEEDGEPPSAHLVHHASNFIDELRAGVELFQDGGRG